MSWKESAFEGLIWASGKAVASSKGVPSAPKSIFILRNNDIGDLLVTTPLFEALRRRFPAARIVAGIGPWNRAVLENNPYLSEVRDFDAPWHNHSVKELSVGNALKFIASSPEAKRLTQEQFEVGIDIFGSNLGMLLMTRAKIPYRIGVRGFRGGHAAAQWCVDYTRAIHVSRANLRIAEHLGAPGAMLPPPRPQLFLTEAETRAGETLWSSVEAEIKASRGGPRILIGPGAGDAEKCWPIDDFAALAHRLSHAFGATVLVVGGKGDRERGARIEAACSSARSQAGEMSLRDTFAAASLADLVLCNTSMLMHAAAAFRKPSLTLLAAIHEPAAEHEALWGYPGTGVILGKGNCAGPVATVQEAFEASCRLLKAEPVSLATAIK